MTKLKDVNFSYPAGYLAQHASKWNHLEVAGLTVTTGKITSTTYYNLRLVPAHG